MFNTLRGLTVALFILTVISCNKSDDPSTTVPANQESYITLEGSDQ